MKDVKNQLLTINGGSSSIRFAVFSCESDPKLGLSGKIERIGATGATVMLKRAGSGPASTFPVSAPDRHAAVKCILKHVEAYTDASSIKAVGHRIVHGMRRSAPEQVSARLLAGLRRASPFAPDHLPIEIELIEAVRRARPGIPQVVCFDTAFHRGMPPVAKLLAIPRRYHSRGVERYGFHGLAYEHLMDELIRLRERTATRGRVILAHLGSGASMAAVLDGRSIETTMGFTPAAGLVMGTRTGDIDPGVLLYLSQQQRIGAGRLAHIVNHESGLLGVSGTNADMRDLLAREGRDERAAAAVELFCYQARRWIGALAAVLGGVELVVFSGGIGENSPVIRERICKGLGFLGLALDSGKNAANRPVISRTGRPVKVRVIAADEERVIAKSVIRVLRLRTAGK
jgi:acetate kinase